MKKREYMLPMVGASSLMTIFGVLCLVVLVLLSMATVRGQQSLSLASAEAAAGYYQADARAEEILARLRQGELPEGVLADGDVYAYTCPISESAHLAVRVRVEGQTWSVLQWQAVSTLQWQENDSLNVWDGVQ